MRFSSIENIESIVVEYQYYQIRQGIDTIELVSILLPSLPNQPKEVSFQKSPLDLFCRGCDFGRMSTF